MLHCVHAHKMQMSLTRAVMLMSLTRVVMLMSLTRAVDTGLDHKGNLNELRRRVFNLVIKQPKVLGECSSRIEMHMNVTFKSFTPQQ